MRTDLPLRKRPTLSALGNDSFKGMGIDYADFNGDGLMDIFVSNIATEYALEESHFAFISTGQIEQMKEGVAPYHDRSEPLGLSRSDWSWDIKLADFNNDTVFEILQATGFVKGSVNRWAELQELAIGNDELLPFPKFWLRIRPGDDLSGHAHNPFYVWDGKERYYDLSAELGLDQPQVSRGIAIADVDGDGDLDFAVANQWEPSHFYRNDCPNCGSYLGLHLRIPIGNAIERELKVYSGHPSSPSYPAIGASVKVFLPDGKLLVAQIDGGNGHSGKQSPDLHFGFGDLLPTSTIIVEIHWRDSSGTIRTRQLKLKPGWHTIELGSQTLS